MLKNVVHPYIQSTTVLCDRTALVAWVRTVHRVGQGGLAEDTISTINAIGWAIANQTNITEQPPTTKHLFGRLAITGNANLWLHHYPTSVDGID